MTSQNAWTAGDSRLEDAGVSVEMSRSLVQAIHHAGISVYYQDADLSVVWAENVPGPWRAACRVGANDADFLSSFDLERIGQAKRRVLATGAQEAHELSMQEGDAIRWFDVWLNRRIDGATGARGILTTMVETTDHKQREQTLKMLLREVSHRSKNLLAIIQSIATQTGRYSGSIDTFLSRFRGRLQSLAASQDLVTLSNWRGADLRALIANQVGRYAAAPRDSVLFDGDNPYLNPNAALHVGLALHELAVNSMSYGALSQPSGAVSISARLATDGEGQRSLTLCWKERIPPTTDDSAVEKRFGSVALERVVPASLRGTADLVIGNGELTYRLTVPAGAAGIE